MNSTEPYPKFQRLAIATSVISFAYSISSIVSNLKFVDGFSIRSYPTGIIFRLSYVIYSLSLIVCDAFYLDQSNLPNWLQGWYFFSLNAMMLFLSASVTDFREIALNDHSFMYKFRWPLFASIFCIDIILITINLTFENTWVFLVCSFLDYIWAIPFIFFQGLLLFSGLSKTPRVSDDKEKIFISKIFFICTIIAMSASYTLEVVSTVYSSANLMLYGKMIFHIFSVSYMCLQEFLDILIPAEASSIDRNIFNKITC